MNYTPEFIKNNLSLFEDLNQTIKKNDLANFQLYTNKLVALAKSNVDLYDIYITCVMNKKYNPSRFETVLTSEISKSPYFSSFQDIDKILEKEHKDYILGLVKEYKSKAKPKLILGIIVFTILSLFLLLFTFIDISNVSTFLFFLLLDIYFIAKLRYL